MKYELRPYQKEASDAAVRFFESKDNKNALIVAPTGCHLKGSLILMYTGELKPVENIRVGDVVMGNDGTPRHVLCLHRGEDLMYRITPLKGEPFVVNGGHILHLHKTNTSSYHSNAGYDEISVADYVMKSNSYKHQHKLHRAKYVSFGNENKKLVEPYFLGVFIGDGCSSNNINITTQREEVVEYLSAMAKREHLGFRKQNQKNRSNKASSYYFPFMYSWKCPNPLRVYIKDIGLYGKKAGDKFIPFEYKTGSRKDRMLLLAGLLDTDSYYDPRRNMFEYCSKSRQLAEDVVFLCRSLGFYAKIGKTKYVNDLPYYRIQITGDLDTIPTKVKIRRGHKRLQKKSIYVIGFNVKLIGKGKYYGFTLDGNHLYCDEQFFVHHNCGKSIIIADIARQLNGNVLVLQPSKEILQQNFAKLRSYGVDDSSIYSASCNSKVISRITFATIGSIINHKKEFNKFRAIIVDECDVINAAGGMYKDFLTHVKRKVLGLTATPYRLFAQQGIVVNGEFKPNGTFKAEEYFKDGIEPKPGVIVANKCMEKFLTRTRPRMFEQVIYQISIQELLTAGFLSRLAYYPVNAIEESRIKRNSTGRDYDEQSLGDEFKRCSLVDKLVDVVNRLLHPKRGGGRTGILVFTKFLEESEELTKRIPNCAFISGETKPKERECILNDFKEGRIKVLANVGVLICGFDYPALDTIVIARPTMSLRFWYQAVGRIIRPYEGKQGWVVDLGGNIERFGEVENFHLVEEKPGMYAYIGYVNNQWKYLTNVYY